MKPIFQSTVLALTLWSVIAHASPKTYAAHTKAIQELAQSHQAGQLTIHKGDAFTPIAQRYAKANDIPLEVAVKGLAVVNPQAFEDAAQNLAVGAALNIPLKEDVIAAAQNGAVASPAHTDTSVTTAGITQTDRPNATQPVPQSSTTQPSANDKAANTANAASTAPAVASNDAANVSSISDLPSWIWAAAAIVMALLLIVWFKRRAVQDKNLIADEEPTASESTTKSRESLTASTGETPSVVERVITTPTESISAVQTADQIESQVEAQTEAVSAAWCKLSNDHHTSQSETGMEQSASVTKTEFTEKAVDETSTSHMVKSTSAVSLLSEEPEYELDDEELMPHTESSERALEHRFARAVGGLSAASLDLSSLSSATENEIEPEVEHMTLAQSEVNLATDESQGKNITDPHRKVIGTFDMDEEWQNRLPIMAISRKIQAKFFNNHFKTPSAQFERITHVSARAITFANAKAEALAATQVPSQVLEDSKTPELDVDVSTFLKQYSYNLPEPTFTSADYEELLDKARLQSWLNLHTPEEVLLFAQDAYEARYEDVAQLMLNDVLLRGDAEQCTMVLRLRNAWSYPQGVH